MVCREKRSRTQNEVKPAENTKKNPQSFLGISQGRRKDIYSNKLIEHASEK